jgi:hypothetical protein
MEKLDSATHAFPIPWWGNRRPRDDFRDDDPIYTTLAVGEEGDPDPLPKPDYPITTLAIGEEGDPDPLPRSVKIADISEPSEGSAATHAVTVGPDGKVKLDAKKGGDTRGAGLRDPDENSPPVAVDDFVFVRSGPNPSPKPIPRPYDTAKDGGRPEAKVATVPPADDDPIFTTLAIGEEGDPDPLPKSVKIAPLANDRDKDGDPLTIATINGRSVEAEDEVELPSGAILKISKDGTIITYSTGAPRHKERPLEEPPADAAGEARAEPEMLTPPRPKPNPYLTDSFTYQASDGEDLSNSATITVTQSPIYYDL